MGRTLVCACATAVALTLAVPAGAALPHAGALVPGVSLGGVRLGEPAAQVRAALGSFYGVCRSCARTTWYFTYGSFDRHGLGVELTSGRVSAVYTLWQPSGWHAHEGLLLGAVEAQVNRLAGVLLPVSCGTYRALVHDDGAARSVYYISGGSLWGFGLVPAGSSPCR